MGHTREDSFEGDPVGRLLAGCLEAEEDAQLETLERACAKHPDLAAELRRRWRALAEVGLAPGAGPDFPERLGEFRLVERLGGGGMGVVYRAIQEPLGRAVALKLVRPELLYFPSARERFRRETEAVAKLQHPGIVPIYTVGEADGIPYFAMELAPGATLAEALRELAGRAPESLTGADFSTQEASEGPDPGHPDAGTWIDACLRVARQVALALEHAHGRGVLHRDIKPSNVVLAPDGTARLVDFGLASTEGEARMTRTGSAPGSLPYMAPEQIRGDRRVDARTDVYALGITLYELLTLQLPYLEADALATRGAILAGRPPSMRARNRDVPRDVETVCLKALDVDPARRYGTAGDLARDLQNALELRPIEARRPGNLLRARRWTQRHRGATAAIALGLALLAGIPSALAVQSARHARELQGLLTSEQEAHRLAGEERDRASLEARDAEAVSGFLTGLFEASDPYEAQGREVTARELLDRGASELETELEDQPEVRARLLERMGLSYAHLGHYAEAAPLLERALDLRREYAGASALDTARALVKLGELRRLAGHEGAVDALEEAVAIETEHLGATAEETVRARVELASALTVAGELDAARALLLELRGLDVPADDPLQLRAMILVNLANVHFRTRDWTACHEAAAESLAIRRGLHEGPDPELVSSLNLVALSAKYLERFDDADAAYAEMLNVTRALYGEGSHHTALVLQNRGALEFRRGDVPAAEELFRESWAIYRETVDLAHPHALGCLLSLAEFAFRRNDWRAACELYLEAVPRARAGVNPGSRAELKTLQNLGLCHWALGELEEAEARLRDARAACAASEGEDSPRVVTFGVPLASVLRWRVDAAAEAEALYRAALAVAEPRAIAPIVAEAHFGLGDLALRAGRLEEAETHLRAALAVPAGPGPELWGIPAADAALGALLLERGGATTEAEERTRRGADDLAARLGPEHFEARAALAR